MSPEAFNKITGRLDAALVALVLVFAFVTACFAVRNSDFFQYLAIGRLIAHGEYHIGKDPFSFATYGVRWVDHSWLYSYCLYLIYNLGAAGAVVLIVLKGVAIAALAGILLVLSRNPGQRWLIPAACTAVAILALERPCSHAAGRCVVFLSRTDNARVALALSVAGSEDGDAAFVSVLLAAGAAVRAMGQLRSVVLPRSRHGRPIFAGRISARYVGHRSHADAACRRTPHPRLRGAGRRRGVSAQSATRLCADAAAAIGTVGGGDGGE